MPKRKQSTIADHFAPQRAPSTAERIVKSIITMMVLAAVSGAPADGDAQPVIPIIDDSAAAAVSMTAPDEETEPGGPDELTAALLREWAAAPKPLAYRGKPPKNSRVSACGTFFEKQCVKCGEWHPATPDYFFVDHGGAGWIKRFGHIKFGKESLQNSVTKPCKACYSGIPQAPKSFAAGLVQNYAQLNVAWYHATYAAQRGRCAITGVVMAQERNMPLAAGIHRRDNNVGHTPENCFLAVQEVNVSQYNAIPCLFSAYDSVFRYLATIYARGAPLDTTELLATVRANLDASGDAAENGVTASSTTDPQLYSAQKRDMHLPAIISEQIGHHVNHDIDCSRDHNYPTSADDLTAFKQSLKGPYVAALRAQEFRCAVSGIPLSIKNTFARFSLDRTAGDPSQPHFTSDGQLHPDTRFICRLFNTPRGVSRKQLVQFFLAQERVPITDAVRAMAEAELASLSQ